MNALQNLVQSINDLCERSLDVPIIQPSSGGNVTQECDAEIQKLLKEYGSKAKLALSKELNAAPSASRILNICSKHTTLIQNVNLDEKEAVISKLTENLSTEGTIPKKTSFGSSKLGK